MKVSPASAAAVANGAPWTARSSTCELEAKALWPQADGEPVLATLAIFLCSWHFQPTKTSHQWPAAVTPADGALAESWSCNGGSNQQWGLG